MGDENIVRKILESQFQFMCSNCGHKTQHKISVVGLVGLHTCPECGFNEEFKDIEVEVAVLEAIVQGLLLYYTSGPRH